MVDIEKTIFSKTDNDRTLNMDEHKKNNQVLEILQKALVELRADGSSKTFLSIMEKLIEIYNCSKDTELVYLQFHLMSTEGVAMF